MVKKTNDAGIKKWLEQKGVDWMFLRDERARLCAPNFLAALEATAKHLKPVTDAMRKAGLI